MTALPGRTAHKLPVKARALISRFIVAHMVKEAKYRMTRLMSLGGTADDPWSRIPRETPYRAGTTPNSAIVAGCVSEAIRWRCPEGVVIIAVELLYGTDCRQTFTYRHNRARRRS